MRANKGTKLARLVAFLRACFLCAVCFLLCAALLSSSAFSPAGPHAKAPLPLPLAGPLAPVPGTEALPPAPLPESFEIMVEPILQAPELPNGCEATSLAMALQYYGFAADKVDLAYSYIPREDFVQTGNSTWGPHPEDAYAGDPADLGFYCFAPPVVAGANLYLSEQGSDHVAVDISGADQATLQAYLAQGCPVLLWTTLDRDEPQYSSFVWALQPDGELYTPYSNLHCEVLCGYDTQNFCLCNPLQGREVASIDRVLRSYEALGGHAVVIL